MGIRYKAGGAMTTSAICVCEVEKVAVRVIRILLTCVGIKSGIIDSFDQRPLCLAGRWIHFEVASDEKLARHGSRWWTLGRRGDARVCYRLAFVGISDGSDVSASDYRHTSAHAI